MCWFTQAHHCSFKWWFEHGTTLALFECLHSLHKLGIQRSPSAHGNTKVHTISIGCYTDLFLLTWQSPSSPWNWPGEITGVLWEGETVEYVSSTSYTGLNVPMSLRGRPDATHMFSKTTREGEGPTFEVPTSVHSTAIWTHKCMHTFTCSTRGDALWCNEGQEWAVTVVMWHFGVFQEALAMQNETFGMQNETVEKRILSILCYSLWIEKNWT